MLQNLKTGMLALAVLAAGAMSAGPSTAQDKQQDKQPIKIGFGMSQTGPLGPNGKSALLAMEIWVEEINAKGGLLGRPVQLVNYDDQSNPSTVPGIYTKLLDVDKVDVIVGGYGTNMIAPAMPIAMQRKKAFMALYGLGVNDDFKYDRYFAMIPSGPEPKTSFTKGFFDTAMAQNPKPVTVRVRTPRSTASRSSTTRAIRLRPPTSRQSCGRSRQPTPTSSSSAPIRSIRSAWCWRRTKSSSTRR
jgi:branched-chain amino acid transport system substrate-binding protein